MSEKETVSEDIEVLLKIGNRFYEGKRYFSEYA